MDVIGFLAANHSGQDVHVLDLTEGYSKHIGYYFWDATNKLHALKPIASMRKDDGWEVKDIRELCAMCKPVHVVIEDNQFKET